MDMHEILKGRIEAEKKDQAEYEKMADEHPAYAHTFKAIAYDEWTHIQALKKILAHMA